MEIVTKKGLASIIIIITLILGATALPTITSSSRGSDSTYVASNTDQELALLHGEVIFKIQAFLDTTSPFNVSYTVPPIYCNQAPILIQLLEDTDAKIINYCIINDTGHPNKVVNFTIEPMEKDENATFHFDFWVLVINNEYRDLPNFVKMPRENELPEDTKIWLTSTKAIQSNNILIKHKARVLKRFTGNNLIQFAEKIASFTGEHRNRFMPISYKFSFPPRHYQDAVFTYLFGGVCTGRANLGTALFRANGVPARDLAVMPTWSKEMWFDMHYISQYYCPNYGWVLVETSLGTTPYEPKNNVIMRVNYPEDENEAGNCFSGGTGGVEYWFWTNNTKIYFPYIGSARHAWIEKELTTDQQNANLAFNLTQDVYELHTKYTGMNLTGENLVHFDNAVLTQKNAIECFNQSNAVGYFDNITIAYNEYKEIEYP